jgi:hypothetical protein
VLACFAVLIVLPAASRRVQDAWLAEMWIEWREAPVLACFAVLVVLSIADRCVHDSLQVEI